MKKLINSYIEAHKLAWSPATLKSERSRLNSIASHISKGPDYLYNYSLERFKPYAIKTLFIRVADFERWSNKTWGYSNFITKNARLFKHAYTRSTKNYGDTLELTSLLSGIADRDLRELAFGIFRNGLRISELRSYDKSTGLVRGKGGRERRLLAPKDLPDQFCSLRELRNLRKELKRLGLKPHDLRKASASILGRKGQLRMEDLMQVMGWSSLQTAASYLQPLTDEKLAEIAAQVLS
jgi:integrase